MRHACIVLALVAMASGLVACGGASQATVELGPGQARADAETNLKAENFCRREGADRRTQSYVRCGVVGFEVGERWVVIEYDKADNIERVRRLEHYPSHARATERWNALVEERHARLGAPSPEARATLAELGEVPGGAVSWVAWYENRRDNLIVGLFLVKPASDRDPRIVEITRRQR